MGVLTIAKDTYFGSTVFTITATNNDTGIARNRTLTINTPQTPSVNTSAPPANQIVDVTSTSKTFTFTNTVPLADPVAWSLTTNPQSSAVSINGTSGVVTVAAGQYFLASNFTVTASNAAISVTNTRSFSVNAPAPPVIVAGSASQQVVYSRNDVSLTFTNSDVRAAPVVWGFTPSTDGVSIDSNGVLKIKQGFSFPTTTFTITASNTAINYTTSLTSYVITAVGPPILSSIFSTTGAIIVGTSVYMDNASSNVVSINQTGRNTGALAWNGVASLPSGVQEVHDTSGITITVGSFAVLRPNKLSLSITATGPSPLYLTSTPPVAFDIFTPATPLIAAATSPADTGTYIPLNTYVSAQSITISQDSSQLSTLTGDLTWAYLSPTSAALLAAIPGTTWSGTATSNTITFAQNAIVVDPTNTPAYYAFTIVARNPALMSSATKTVRVYAPRAPAWDPTSVSGNVKRDTSTGSTILALIQTVSSAGSNPHGIKYTIVPNEATLLKDFGIMATLANDQYTFTIPRNQVITPVLTITATATNGVAQAILTSFTLECGRKPVIDAPSTWTPAATSGTTFIVNTATSKTIVANFSSDLLLTTISASPLPNGITLSTTQTTATFTLAQNATVPTATFTLSIGSAVSGTINTTQTFSIDAQAKPPAAPVTGFAVKSTTASSITFEWGGAVDADSFILSGLGFTTVNEIIGTSYTLVSLASNTTYGQFTLTPFNGLKGTAVTFRPTMTKPNPPTNLQTSIITATTATVTFTASFGDAQSYTGGGGGTHSISGTTDRITGLMPSTTYTFTVDATNTSGTVTGTATPITTKAITQWWPPVAATASADGKLGITQTINGLSYSFSANASTGGAGVPYASSWTPPYGTISTGNVEDTGILKGSTYIQNIGQVSGDWYQIRLPYPVSVTTYIIGYRPGFIYRTPATWYLCGSNDGSTWYSVDFRTGYDANFWSTAASNRYTFNPTPSTGTKYSYYRFHWAAATYDVLIEFAVAIYGTT